MKRIYEDDAIMFDAIMENCIVDMDISSWDYSSDEHTGYNYNARPLTSKKTGHHVGWLVYKEWLSAEGEITDETYINMKELDE